MQITRKRRPFEIVQGFFWLCHPVPVSFHVCAVALFAFIAGWSTLPNAQTFRVILLVIVAHMLMQLSIAVLNDYCDRFLDAASKPEKPIARGIVHPREALIAGILLFALMILLLLSLPLLALIISLLYYLLGLGYNLGLKATPLSGFVFALAIPLIPLYAFVGVGHMFALVFWLVPIGALLGVALNLASSLADIDGDAAQNARTLAVVLGKRWSLLVSLGLILVSSVLIGVFTITRVVPAHLWLIVVTLLLTVFAIGGLLMFFLPRTLDYSRYARDAGASQRADMWQIYFYLVVCTCFVLAAGWLMAAIL